ncbi:MAG: ferredoxin [Bacilli bacterium]|nr:ferredoxin [Bacilli bacterium]
MEKIKVNKEKCLGCGMCVGINSDVFEFDDDGLAKANNEKITEENEEEVKEAINSCPVSAIEKEEK